MQRLLMVLAEAPPMITPAWINLLFFSSLFCTPCVATSRVLQKEEPGNIPFYECWSEAFLQHRDIASCPFSLIANAIVIIDYRFPASMCPALVIRSTAFQLRHSEPSMKDRKRHRLKNRKCEVLKNSSTFTMLCIPKKHFHSPASSQSDPCSF